MKRDKYYKEIPARRWKREEKDYTGREGISRERAEWTWSDYQER